MEDNPGDIRLIREAVKECGQHFELDSVMDGIQAMDFLFKREAYTKSITPDLILLDLNLPKKDGRSVLKEIKSDPILRIIPVIILTISQAEEDILQCYNNHTNCYVTKPFEIEHLIQLIKSITYFWFHVVSLPPRKELGNE